jgi:hypothetical protein
LKEAVVTLPMALGSWAAIEEAVTFTEKGGWHKVDKLLPLVYPPSWEFGRDVFDWLNNLDRLIDKLRVSRSSLGSLSHWFIVYLGPKSSGFYCRERVR